MNKSLRSTLISLPIILLGTFSLLYFGALSPNTIPSWFSDPWIRDPFVDGKLKYQVVTFGIALLILGLIFFLKPIQARQFYKLGNLNALAKPIRWLDIKSTDRWGKVGTTFAVIVSLATGAFIYFNLVRGLSFGTEIFRVMPYILILSGMNSFTEEAITRLSVIVALDGLLSRPMIYLISALIFGIPHLFGIPGGFLGSLMAGFLGWLLAKSIAETEGIFWAWFIHFLQDVIIFGGLFLVNLIH